MENILLGYQNSFAPSCQANTEWRFIKKIFYFEKIFEIKQLSLFYILIAEEEMSGPSFLARGGQGGQENRVKIPPRAARKICRGRCDAVPALLELGPGH